MSSEDARILQKRAEIKELLEARQKAIYAHQHDPTVGVPSSIVSGLMIGSVAGVLASGVLMLATRKLKLPMEVIGKGVGICGISGAVLNVAAYYQKYGHNFKKSGEAPGSVTRNDE
jgi:ABC-type uncharacterized transport system permease subunit